MILEVINRRIRKAFSDGAMQYDALTGLHKEIGRDLLKKMRAVEPCERILDIGMGTGWLTGKIAFYFPGSLVVGLDFAEGMLNVAQKNHEDLRLVQADCAALPFRNESLDCIVSNLAFQWVDDLEQSFRLCRQALKPGGVLCLTMFGYHTLQELFVSLQESLDRKNLSMRRLPTLEAVRSALEQSGFDGADVDYERIKVRFPDMMGMLKWTKDIGANRLDKDFFVGRDLLNKTARIYDEKFRDHFGIYTTFEVIWVFCKKV